MLKFSFSEINIFNKNKLSAFITGSLVIFLALFFTALPVSALGTNIVPNSSVETASTTNSSLPKSWNKEKSGVNSTVFSYLNQGHTGTRSLKVNTTSYTSGDSHYKFDSQAVVPNAEYEFSVYYKSNVYTEVYAEITLSNNELDYQYLGYIWPSSSWNKYSTRFVMPSNAAKVSVYATVYSVGYIITDDYSLAKTSTPTPFNRPMVTITIDESANTVYKYGYPLFKKYNIPGTFYVLSSELGKSGKMTKTQFNNYRNLGFEIGSHTVSHPYLTQIGATRLNNELMNSQTAISNYFGGIAIPSFASPYGEYNFNAINKIKSYYQSHRTTDSGFNSLDSFDPYLIKAFSIESDMSADYVKGLINQAIRDKTWLVLVYHDIKPDDGSGFLWTTTPQNMETVLSYLKLNNVPTLTTSQAINEIQSQR